MDYKYIEQLMERYWQCETTLEEEDILRSFFSQETIPASLLPYRDLFVYGQEQRQDCPLGDEFDQRMLAMTGEPAQVKARIVTLGDRLKPLFKAAAIVAVILTLGNAIQMPFQQGDPITVGHLPEMEQPIEGVSMAKGDTIKIDTLQQVQPSAAVLK